MFMLAALAGLLSPAAVHARPAITTKHRGSNRSRRPRPFSSADRGRGDRWGKRYLLKGVRP